MIDSKISVGRYSGPVFIWFTALMLFLSGFVGVLLWPPPTLIAYETLIQVTGIKNQLGGIIRMVLASVAIIAWFLPYRWFRFVSYYAATLCTMLLAISFWDTSQGFASGSWIAALICGSMAIWAEGKNREADYDRHGN